MKKKQIFQFVLWAISPLLLASCSSCGLKAECEKTNWYQKGFDIAQRGERPASDSFTQTCRKEDYPVNESQLDVGFKAGMAHYCLPDTVYATGKKGQFFNHEFCDPADFKVLMSRHKAGVTEFCTPESAYTFAAQGGVYNKICIGDAEKKFLPSYKQGRKKYLGGMISENEQRISRLQNDLYNLESRKSSTQSQLSSVTSQIGYSRALNSNNPQYVPDQGLENQRSNLQSTISNLNYEIDSNRDAQKKLQEDIYNYKRELNSLEGP